MGAAAGAAPQSPTQTQPQAQQPVFRSGVDLVTVDVLVVDKDGRPIPELKAEDFTVTVDGKPRRIASVEHLTHFDRFATAPDRTQVPNLRREDRVMMRAEYSSNTKSPPGRMFVLVVDSGNMTRGGGRGAMEAAGQFVQKLAPNDLVAVVSLPAGVTMDFTADRVAIKSALLKIVGGGATKYLSNRSISLAESFALVTGNQRRLWDEAIRLECNWARNENEWENCRSTLEADARSKFNTAREAAEASERSFEVLLRRLSIIDGQKHVIFIGQNLVTGSSFGYLDGVARSQVAGRTGPGCPRQPLRAPHRQGISRGLRRARALPLPHPVRRRAAAQRWPRRSRRAGWRDLLQSLDVARPHLRSHRSRDLSLLRA